MWILIITLFVSGGVTVTSIEFSSRSSCIEAGQQYKVPNTHYYMRHTLLCVKK